MAKGKEEENNPKTNQKGSKIDNFGDKAGTNNFAKNPQNINRNGRPKKLLTIGEENGYKRSEVLDVMAYTLTMTQTERTEYLKQDPDGLESICIRAIDKASAKGEYQKAKDIIEQVIGKAKQSVDMTHDLKGEAVQTFLDQFKDVE
jgi:hypothetical protein